MSTQWHPLFAELLRPLLQPHYEVRTDVPVGDLPREADIVLLRRIEGSPPPFHGLWRHLTPWNVLEFKGPTVRPRRDDLDSLVEVGLGIQRHLNEQRPRRSALAASKVSWWYLATRIGPRLRRAWEQQVGTLEPVSAGMWRCVVLGRLLFLVSGQDLPLEEESVPLHLLGRETPEAVQALAEFVVSRPGLWQRYGEWLVALHNSAFRRVASMVRTRKKPFEISISGLVDLLGVPELINRIGLKRMVEEAGLQRVINVVGLPRVINEVGLPRVINEVGLEGLAAALTPAQWRELQRLKS
jgi:hypothetical protein